MLWKLLLLLILVVAAELCALVGLAQATSVWVVVLVILATGVGGVLLVVVEGPQVPRRILGELSEARLPTDSLLNAVLTVVAAALLISPGVLADVVGLLLLLPPVRRHVRLVVKGWMQRKVDRRVEVFRKFVGRRIVRRKPPDKPSEDGRDGGNQVP